MSAGETVLRLNSWVFRPSGFRTSGQGIMPFLCINRYACFSSSLHRDLCHRRFAPISWNADQDSRRTASNIRILH